MPDADLHFYFDPVCPFAWMTSKWVRLVMAERDYTVDWRFISLRQVNAEVDYHSHFPPQYEASHTAGLRLLRVAAAARATHGRDCVGPLYAAMGKRLFDVEPPATDHDEEGWTIAAHRRSWLRSSRRSASRHHWWRRSTTTRGTWRSARRPTRRCR